MALYEKIGTDEDAKGFLVKFGYWDTYFVNKGDLYIADTTVMLKTERHYKHQVWEDGNDFSWGERDEGVKIIRIDGSVVVNVLYNIPEWITRSNEKSEEEAEAYRKEKRKNGFIRKMFRIIVMGKA